jgi:hypothetical protein
VFTVQYALSPYIKQICFVFKGLMNTCTARPSSIVFTSVVVNTKRFPRHYRCACFCMGIVSEVVSYLKYRVRLLSSHQV